MAPRARIASPKQKGIVRFMPGIQDFQIKEFLNKNNIKSRMISRSENIVEVHVPPAEQYIIPDDIYVWFENAE